MPQNRLILYESDENGHPRPVSPYKAADPDLTAVVARCHDLRPTNFSRAGVDRDDVWVKTQFLSIRTWISGILADFNRSGEQQGKSEADLEWISKDHQERWVYHCSAKSRRYPGVTSYACGILERGSLESLGRDCGKGGRDSSVNGKSYGSDNCYDLFAVGVYETNDPNGKLRYLSEDYYFSRLWASIGGEVWADVSQPLSHFGTQQFRGHVGSMFVAPDKKL